MPIKYIDEDTIKPFELKEFAEHKVTFKTLQTLEKVMLQQDRYGMEKYQKPLAATMNYDWLAMYLEEMADGLKYIQNEIDRKEAVIHLLEHGIESVNPKKFIQAALEILKISGTGK
jgi:hypothetical protein